MLRVRLIAGLAIEVDGRRVEPPRSRRGRALLAWLALERRMHPRGELAGRFWPDVLDASARTSLRSALVELRAALGPAGAHALIATRTAVGLDAGDGVWVDVEEVERLAARGELEEAVALGDGELLADLDDDWVYAARDGFGASVSALVERLADAAERRGDLPGAVQWSRRLALREPLSDAVHRTLMRRLAARGETAAGLAVYERFRERLARDMAVAPAADTRALAAELRTPPAPEATPPVPLPALLTVRDATPFTGREPPLAALREEWARARGGERRAALVAGSPGIGKTRLAARFAAEAHASGAAVLLGRCFEEHGAPYGPFADALREYAATAADGRLARWPELGASELQGIIPGLPERLPGLRPASAGDDTAGARFRVFNAFAALLADIASDRPLLLVVDDLHWAGELTLRLLAHVLHRPDRARLMVLATYRRAELSVNDELAATVGALRDDGLAGRILLEGVDREAVATIAGAAAGTRPPPDVAAALHAHSDGNPFFVEELVRDTAQEGDWPSPEAITRMDVPRGVKDLIGRRVAHIGVTPADVLQRASVLGREFDFELLAAIASLDAGALAAALDEGVRHRVVGPAGDGFAFTHALVRDALYEQLPPMRRAQLHLAAARALEELPPDRRDGRLSELARHLALCAPLPEHRDAAGYALRAARRALADLAWDQAAADFELSLHLSGDSRGNEEQRLDALLGLGEARKRAGDRELAREAFEQAAAAARRAGSAAALAIAALGFAGRRIEQFGTSEERELALLAEALDALGDEPAALRAQVMARLAESHYHSSSLAPIDALSREALALARASGDSDALATALTARQWALWAPGNAAERERINAEAYRLARAAGSADRAAEALVWHIAALLEVGDRAGVARDVAAHAALAESLGENHHTHYRLVLEAMVALLDGPLPAAEQLVLAAAAAGDPERSGDAAQLLGVQLMTLRADQGGMAELETPIRAFIERFPHVPGWHTGLTWALADGGRPAAAREEWDALAADNFARIPRDAFWLPCMAALANVAVLLGDARRAAAVYGVIDPYAGTNVGLAWGAYWAPVAHYLGELALVTGDLDSAGVHLENAAAEARANGGRVAALRTDTARGELLARRGDRAAAHELLERTRAACDELGMSGVADRAGAVLA